MTIMTKTPIEADPTPNPTPNPCGASVCVGGAAPPTRILSPGFRRSNPALALALEGDSVMVVVKEAGATPPTPGGDFDGVLPPLLAVVVRAPHCGVDRGGGGGLGRQKLCTQWKIDVPVPTHSTSLPP